MGLPERILLSADNGEGLKLVLVEFCEGDEEGDGRERRKQLHLTDIRQVICTGYAGRQCMRSRAFSAFAVHGYREKHSFCSLTVRLRAYAVTR